MNLSHLAAGDTGTTLRTTFNAMVDAVGAVSLAGKKLAVIGDSIDVTTWEATAISILGLDSVIQMAAAGARHNDNDGGGTTAINMQTYSSVSDDNTLSNQVRALIRDSYTLGGTLTWTHPISGYVTTISSSYGTGLGNTRPDLIYIKLGQNGGQGALVDADFDTVIGQAYSALDRLNQYSSMRWAIETLRINFPTVPIFIATNWQTTSSYATMKIRNDISIRMAKFMNCPVINLFEELGMIQTLEPYYYSYDGTHPGNGSNSQYDGRILLGRFIARRIQQYYIDRT